MNDISIDIETFSSVDLKAAGVYKYSESDDFSVLLFAYAVDNGEVIVIDLLNGEKIPDEIIAALSDNSVRKWAFNAQFERVCLSRFLGFPYGTYLDPDGWYCTKVWAATLSLPLTLADVGAVLNVEQQKMKEGKALIKYFCMPCNPEKNKGRIRHYPCDAPEKWEIFKEYNKRDVETEMAIKLRLSKFPMPESEWVNFHVDQRINDRGVALDMGFVRSAIALDSITKAELTEQLCRLTHLDNPNSVSQMKSWFEKEGVQLSSLSKKDVAEMLKTASSPLRDVLILRQQLAKSSVKKYTAMQCAVCKDGRAHGMFQFYGANRTGRFAGRIIQLHNLPQNHLPDLKEARDLVRSGAYEDVATLYESIPSLLSELIRTAFVPSEGCRFIVADYSAIEARVLSWFAGEEWRIKVFAEGGDIYCATASKMFHCKVEKNGENGHLRQKGKQRKLDALEDLIESANEKPVLVAYWFKHDLERIKQRFEVREIKEARDIRDWNEKKIPIAVIHPAAAGHGLNLQDGGSTLIWFGLTWSLELYQQTNARLWRQGQTADTVIIQHIVTKGTIDEQILKALSAKEKTQEALISAVKAELDRKD